MTTKNCVASCPYCHRRLAIPIGNHFIDCEGFARDQYKRLDSLSRKLTNKLITRPSALKLEKLTREVNV